MKFRRVFFWGLLMVLITLVNLVNAVLGTRLPVADLEEAAAEFGCGSSHSQCG